MSTVATILVIDDDPITIRLLTHALGKHGHRVVGALRPHDARLHLATTPVDLVILDLAMPEVDGLTLLRQLRADPSRRALPVVMLTASGQDQDRIAARAEGADAFLTKPASSWELGEVVGQLLERAL
jgi:two-component system, chemotaxis family, chemotaxis protein CheY